MEKKKATKNNNNEWSIFELVSSCCLIKRQTYRLLAIDLRSSFLESTSFLTFDFLLGISEQLSAVDNCISLMQDTSSFVINELSAFDDGISDI